VASTGIELTAGPSARHYEYLICTVYGAAATGRWRRRHWNVSSMYAKSLSFIRSGGASNSLDTVDILVAAGVKDEKPIAAATSLGLPDAR